jgi:hypothetical protein
MDSAERPKRFYLFPDGNSYKIHEMTDVEAARLWDYGSRFVDMPQETLAAAQELKAQYLMKPSPLS